ncbi:hypothetical protein P7K49_013101 [Saguinus oedipus]|uniref:Uncharacterized protein n=1 Tax=Saguinus oedipus TaxID=9490 RepID=A0ABQ9VEX9_SAGOE|nr:hypothetical protein P7K49_013101 [Saguinus oedipus]
MLQSDGSWGLRICLAPHRMLQTLKELKAPASEPRAAAFQHLLLLVGIYFFKQWSPADSRTHMEPATLGSLVLTCTEEAAVCCAHPQIKESCDLLGDIQTCIRKSLGERCHGSCTKAIDPQEPPCVEVLVEILLALLAQPRHLMCQVAQSVFGHVCSHLTLRALQLILDVLNPETSEDEVDHVVVMDKSDEQWLKAAEVLPVQARWGGRSGKITEGGEESEDEEELGDEAMMALDQNLTSIFAEQKLWIQARQDEKSKPQKEKVLQCDFQIWVSLGAGAGPGGSAGDQAARECPGLELLEPLLGIIQCSLRSSSSKQEQDLLHKTACIFMHHLCRGRHYCHDLGDRVEALNGQVARLVEQAGCQPDSTALYHFNASLYLLQVLKGGTAKGCMHEMQEELEAGTDPSPMTKGSQRPSPGLSQLSHLAWAAGCLDLNLTIRVYSSALSSFLTKLHSPLTVPMFLSLFSWHPVSVRAHPAHLGSPLSPSPTHASQPSLPHQVLCKSLLPILV